MRLRKTLGGGSMRRFLTLALFVAAALPLAADEGMWLFNAPPRAALKQRYGFEPAQAWLDHLQKASIRFNSGGSAGLLSHRGPVVTNHHLPLSSLSNLPPPH